MFKNFIQTLRRYKLSSLLNILGLSIAFAAFILIMIQVYAEFTADTDQPKHKNTFRLEGKYNTEERWGINLFGNVYTSFIDGTPQIKETALFLYGYESIIIDGNVYEQIPSLRINNDISKVFDIKMVEGVFTSALEPASALICRSLARQLFGDKPSVGQQIKLSKEYVITGVYEDFAPNSTLTNGLIIAGRAGNSVSSVYCLFADGVDAEKIAADFNAGALKTLEYAPDVVKLVPLADTYFDNQFVSNTFVKRGSRTTTIVLFSIAVLIIIIALINFINFSTALAPVRIKALNIRGVFGSSRTQLRMGLVTEAMLFTTMAYCISLVLIAIVSDTSFTTADITIMPNLPVVVGTAFLALGIGIIAGIYPAFYCTRFAPALVLKGSFGLSTRGRILRVLLLSIQFVISISLIVCALFVHLQNRYLADKNLGYDSRNVVVLSSFYDDAKLELITQKVKALAGVQGVAKYNGSFGLYDGDMIDDMIVDGDTVRINSYFVDCEFTELMGIPITQGRSFVELDRNIFDDNRQDTTSLYNVIVNQKALRILNTALDSVIHHGNINYRVIGVTPDVITSSMYSDIQPVMFIKSNQIHQLAIRVDGGNSFGVLEQIREIVKTEEPVELWKLGFFDTELADMYQKERDLAELITLFSMLAIVISLMGVFGLVLFETQYRRKEIGLRKINGATIWLILGMFNGKFTWIIAICFLVALPISWYGVNEWISGFAYRTPMHWWVFAVALLIVLAITLLTVTIQSWRAATENPVKSLKSE